MSTTTLTVYRSYHERLAACIAHAGAALAWFLAPLIVFLVVGRSSPWARYQALQSLLWSLLGTLAGLVTFGVAVPIFLVWHLYAAVKTTNDGDYEYPLVSGVAHRVVFGDR